MDPEIKMTYFYDVCSESGVGVSFMPEAIWESWIELEGHWSFVSCCSFEAWNVLFSLLYATWGHTSSSSHIHKRQKWMVLLFQCCKLTINCWPLKFSSCIGKLEPDLDLSQQKQQNCPNSFKTQGKEKYEVTVGQFMSADLSVTTSKWNSTLFCCIVCINNILDCIHINAGAGEANDRVIFFVGVVCFLFSSSISTSMWVNFLSCSFLVRLFNRVANTAFQGNRTPLSISGWIHETNGLWKRRAIRWHKRCAPFKTL